MAYIVLARKWRPRFFQEVVGQGHVARTLKNAIAQDRVAHAYLFTGGRGVGKTSTARILAKALNCHQGPTDTPCYACPSCEEISKGQSVDVFEIDGASNRGINEIRELREGVRYAPSRDRFKIYIIDEVHMLTTEAFNALLKTLEEPPGHVKFIFATTEPQKIPVTILSRCQRFDFKRIVQHDIVEHLIDLCEKEQIQAEKAALQLLARQAAGGMRDAMSLLDQVISFAGSQITEEQVIQILGVANRKHLFDVSEAVIARDAQAALLCLDDVYRYGYDLHQFASELVAHFRDLTVCKVVANPERVTGLTESELTLVQGQIATCPNELLHRYFSVMMRGAQDMSRSPYPKLLFEMTLVRLCALEPLVSIDLMVDRLRELEGLLDDPDADGDEAKKKSHELTPLMAPPAPQPPRAVTPQAAPAQAQAPPAQPARPLTQPAPQPPAMRPPEPLAPPMHPAGVISAPPVEAPAPVEGATPQGVAPAASAPPASEAPAPEAAPPAFVTEESGDADGEEGIDEDDFHRAASAPPELHVAPRPALTEAAAALEESGDDDDEPAAGPQAVVARPLPELDLSADPLLVWREIVDHLRYEAAPLAAALEHAYVDQLDAKLVRLSFADMYLSFVREGQRGAPLTSLLSRLFGRDVALEIERCDERDRRDQQNLSKLRDAAERARHDAVYDATEQHPAVTQAMALFSPTQVKFRVALHEREA